jgi:hypothetical protein
MPTLLRSWSNRPLHWTPRKRAVRTELINGREVCQYCSCPPERRCGYLVGGFLFGEPCTRHAGHKGDHVCCVGREHARRWRHQAKKKAA